MRANRALAGGVGLSIAVSGVLAVSPANAETVLRPGTANAAELLPREVNRIGTNMRQGLTRQYYGHPAYPGASVLAARNGVVVANEAAGFAVKYANPSQLLPPRKRIRARTGTMWDLASISKTFTATLTVRAIAKFKLQIENPVRRYLPSFVGAGKDAVTIRMLLTHTSGLPPDPTPALWDARYADNAQRWAAVMTTPLQNTPGSTYTYSDVNYLVLGKLVEKLYGKPLQDVVRNEITKPLGMTHTRYNPPRSWRHRIAQTEWQMPPTEPRRGMVWGSPHDENAWAVGGVAGHAGLFSTTRDMAIYAQTVLNEGAYGGRRILPRRLARAAYFRDYNRAFPGDGHSLIFQINQPNLFGAMTGPHTVGHAGYTGTSLAIDRKNQSFAILLTNRVDPSRTWTPLVTPDPQRRAVGDALARAVAVAPPVGRYSWFSGMVNPQPRDKPLARPGVLTFPITIPRNEKVQTVRIGFNMWHHLIPAMHGQGPEQAVLQVSRDGGRTWRSTSFRASRGDSTRTYLGGKVTGLSSNGWWRAGVKVSVPANSDRILARFVYTDGASWQGRGIYVNNFRARVGSKIVFDSQRATDSRMVRRSGGFQRSSN